MKNSGYDNYMQDYVSATRHSCPMCGTALIRTPRRPVDYLISRFTPVQRFRCQRFACLWQGNIRVEQAGSPGHSVPSP